MIEVRVNVSAVSCTDLHYNVCMTPPTNVVHSVYVISLQTLVVWNIDITPTNISVLLLVYLLNSFYSNSFLTSAGKLQFLLITISFQWFEFLSIQTSFSKDFHI